jgi:hypothetical protein
MKDFVTYLSTAPVLGVFTVFGLASVLAVINYYFPDILSLG